MWRLKSVAAFMLLSLLCYSTSRGQSSGSASVFLITRAYVITKDDTIDVSSTFTKDTSALVIARYGTDTSHFTIVNIRGEQVCIGEVVKETLGLGGSTVTYSGRFVCDVGAVVSGNHFFISDEKPTLQSGLKVRCTVDVIFDQPFVLRFITDRVDGVAIPRPLAQQ